MAIKPGMVVADIGTGTGYMLPYLSQAAGPGGRVIGEDIFPDFLEKAENAAKQHKLTNVQFIQGTETDPGLPESGVDVALALESYHHWNYPEKMLAALHRELRDGGRLVIVDYYKRPDAMPGGRAVQHIRLDDGGCDQGDRGQPLPADLRARAHQRQPVHGDFREELRRINPVWRSSAAYSHLSAAIGSTFAARRAGI